MIRAFGLVLGSASFASLAALTIAASPGQAPPGSAVTGLAHTPSARSSPLLDAFNQPTLDSLTPSSGPTAGGNDVVIAASGGGLLGSTDVTFGGTDINVTPCGTAPCFNVDSDTQITVVGIPGGSAGAVNVTVTTPTGTTAPLAYTYVAPPTLTSLSPTSGSTAGGNDVILTGTNFTSATSVDFGALNPALCGSGFCFSIDSDTQITVHTVPAHAAGGVSVDVVTPGGTTGTQTYTYTTPPPPPPTLTSLNPTSGSTAGGNDVVLTGTSFTGATDVNFGPNDLTPCQSAPCFTVDSDTQITVHSVPGNGAGSVNVTVTTGGGTSGPQSYTYTTPPPPLPTLSKLSPTSGSTAGGNDVVLTGTNFTGATDVNFGPNDLTPCGSGSCFTVDSDTQITVHSVPGQGAGSVNVTVTTAGGTSGSRSYTYVTPAPTLNNVSPSSGSTLGGNNVILTGTNFTGATDVNVGAHDLTPCPTAPCFTFNSDTKITVTMPANASGSVNVDVVTPAGTSGAQSYTYVTPPPTLSGINPSFGSIAGGNNVVLTGTNFTGATDVNVGSHDLTPCPSAPCFTVDSDSQITVTMPADAPGNVNVSVVTPGGNSGNLSYTYVASPTVTGVSPNAGAPVGGNSVTLRGTDFEAAGSPITSKVTIGTAAPITATPCVTSPTAPCFTVDSATQITIKVLPPGSGMVHITVTTSVGTSTPTSADIYTYVTAFPAVTQVLPKEGATGGGEFVEIFGTNFGSPNTGFATTDVLFGSKDVSSTAYPCQGSPNGCFLQVGTGQLDVYTPNMSGAGTFDVRVVTPGGTTNPAPPADQYTFVPPGAYTALTPFRICDTRSTSTAPQCRHSTLGQHGSVAVHMLGGQIPLNTQAVVVNITAINHSSSPTFVTAYPTGTSVPLASNINLAGSTVEANLVIVQLGAGGEISIFNSVGSADVIVDVEGFFAPPTGSSAGAFHSIPPLRICDSRGGAGTECAGATSIPLQTEKWRPVKLSGLPPNVPPGTPSIPTSGAAAAVFNLTATAGTQPTYLSVTPALAGASPCPTKAPLFSNLNPSAGTSLPNRVISNLGPNQEVCIFSAAGSINFIIDVNGWFGTSSAPAGAFFYSVPPTRICDTRSTSGTRCASPTPLTAGATKTIAVAGVAVVPAESAHSTQPVAVVANLTGIAGTAATYFTLYPADIAASAKPRASDLNPGAGQVIANLDIVKLATTTNNGELNLYNAVGSINAILDVAGWFQ